MEAEEQKLVQTQNLEYLRHVDLENRIIYLSRDIDGEVYMDFCKALDHLERLDPSGDVTVKINCLGGDIHSGLGIIDHFRTKTNIHLITKCEGIAASMAAWILCCGDERVMTKNSYVMIHNGQYGFSSEDFSRQEEERKYHKDVEARMWKMLGDVTKHTAKWWAKKCLVGDLILNSSKAKKTGLVDKVI